MGVIVILVGLLLLLFALAAVAFGVFMALDPKNREQGRLFAIWWVPGVAAAGGVLMGDVVTFTIGLACFVVAGAVFLLVDRASSGEPAARRRRPAGVLTEGTTTENETGSSYNEAAS